MTEWTQKLTDLTNEDLELLSDAVRNERLRRGVEHKTWKRCPKCQSTGSHKGGYCDCSVGRDLRRVETGSGGSYDTQVASAERDE